MNLRCRPAPFHLLLPAAAVAGWLLAAAAPAPAGEYVVAQCHEGARGYEDARFERTHGGDYSFGKHCADAARGNTLQVRNITGAPRGRRGEIRWHSPAGTTIAGVRVEGRLRNDAGHEAMLLFRDAAGRDAGILARGDDGGAAFRVHARSFAGGGRHAFVTRLECRRSPRCPRSEHAKAWVRSLRLTMRDVSAPRLALDGELVGTGWVRGERDLSVDAADAGSGVRRVELTVNGRAIPPTGTFDCATIAGTAWARRLAPCAARRTVRAAVPTGAAPFADGPNELVACARDFGPDGNRTCTRRTVLVDNTPPATAFAAARDREDPELLRAPASDAHSGIVNGRISFRPLAGGEWRALPTRLVEGELRARIDSAAEPRGRYLFRAEATDRAGNRNVTSLTTAGKQMVLELPLKERSRLRASIAGPGTVDYGERARISGRLAGPGSAPIGGERVRIVERYEPGSAVRTRARRVRTDARGRFHARLAAGPSRRVAVRFAGTRRYLPARSSPDRLGVRGRASLRIAPSRVRAGSRARFRGRIGTAKVALPAAGKTVELQAREAGAKRFRTVGRAFRTDRRGRWSTRYRFGRFYRQATRFHFRLRITRELRWPYRSPAHSPVRSLVVLPRR